MRRVSDDIAAPGDGGAPTSRDHSTQVKMLYASFFQLYPVTNCDKFDGKIHGNGRKGMEAT
jgi:hypothetical protein